MQVTTHVFSAFSAIINVLATAFSGKMCMHHKQYLGVVVMLDVLVTVCRLAGSLSMLFKGCRLPEVDPGGNHIKQHVYYCITSWFVSYLKTDAPCVYQSTALDAHRFYI